MLGDSCSCEASSVADWDSMAESLGGMMMTPLDPELAGGFRGVPRRTAA